MHELFGTKHLILIAISAVLIVGFYFATRKMKFSTICKTLFYTGIVSEFIKIFYYITQNEETLGGILPKTDLPFHLCSIQIIFITIIVFCKNEKLKKIILSFMLPSCLFGGIAAILIATDTSRNGLWIITAQYFLYHIALVVFSLHLFTNKEIKLTINDYFNCLKFVVVLLFFAIYLNSIIYDGTNKINFMYVVSPPQEGLPYLNENQGWLMYIIKYAILVVFCITMCYIKPIITAIKQKCSKSVQPLNNVAVDAIPTENISNDNNNDDNN